MLVLQEKKYFCISCGKCEPHSDILGLSAYILVSYWPGQQAFASHSLEGFASSMPACLIIDKSYAAWD
jgi:hypothetical protein